MLTTEELYAGFPKEQAAAYRREAVANDGAEVVEESENKVRQLGKEGFAALQAEQDNITKTLLTLVHQAPDSETVQQQIKRHFANMQAFGGPSVGAGARWARPTEAWRSSTSTTRATPATTGNPTRRMLLSCTKPWGISPILPG